MSASGAVGYIYENVGVHDEPDDAAVGYTYENATSGAPSPVLWEARPSLGSPEEIVAVYGQGWSGSSRKVFFDAQGDWDGSEPIDPAYEMTATVAATLVPATGDAYGASRAIPASGEPNVEHWKVTVQVAADAVIGTHQIRLQSEV
jgi:hypothetical protein